MTRTAITRLNSEELRTWLESQKRMCRKGLSSREIYREIRIAEQELEKRNMPG